MATSMKDLVGDPLDEFAKKFTEEFIELGIRPEIFKSARFSKVTGVVASSWLCWLVYNGNSEHEMDELNS